MFLGRKQREQSSYIEDHCLQVFQLLRHLCRKASLSDALPGVFVDLIPLVFAAACTREEPSACLRNHLVELFDFNTGEATAGDLLGSPDLTVQPLSFGLQWASPGPSMGVT